MTSENDPPLPQSALKLSTDISRPVSSARRAALEPQPNITLPSKHNHSLTTAGECLLLLMRTHLGVQQRRERFLAIGETVPS